MTAPVATPRTQGVGHPLDDGMSTLYTFAANPLILLWERSSTPVGFDNGDPIDITNMHNVKFRTKAPRVITEVTDSTITVAYDPKILGVAGMLGVPSIIGLPTTITETLPDGSTLAYYGYMKSFIRNEHSEGAVPEATVTIVCTNYDPVACVEAGPVWTDGPGTCSYAGFGRQIANL